MWFKLHHLHNQNHTQYLASDPAINTILIQYISQLSYEAMKRKRKKNYTLCSWDKNGTSKNISPSVSFDSWLPASYALQNTPSFQSRHLKIDKWTKSYFWSRTHWKKFNSIDHKEKRRSLDKSCFRSKPKTLCNHFFLNQTSVSLWGKLFLGYFCIIACGEQQAEAE